jgi:hypothetical protein
MEMNKLGYNKFKIHQHTLLWKKEDAKNQNKNYGVQVVNTWYWYQEWFDFVKKHCEDTSEVY